MTQTLRCIRGCLKMEKNFAAHMEGRRLVAYWEARRGRRGRARRLSEIVRGVMDGRGEGRPSAGVRRASEWVGHLPTTLPDVVRQYV